MIFLIAMGAEYLFCMISIETHARAFLALIILAIAGVESFELHGSYVCPRVLKEILWLGLASFAQFL